MEKTGVVNGRFQVLHLKHMEYILAAKMRCRKLYIGLTNPDSLHTRESVNDENRSARSANPLTYFEPVSYPHLDVYKRQVRISGFRD